MWKKDFCKPLKIDREKEKVRETEREIKREKKGGREIESEREKEKVRGREK